MASYVLVHGGFSGGWVWREVAHLLRTQQNLVFTPTLTGLGERAHLAHPDLGLNTHIQDIIGVIECEALTDVILVGHSSSAMVVTGVAEQIPEKIRYLVYIDTIAPEDGQSWLDLLGEEISTNLLALAKAKGDGWRVPLIPDPPQFQPHPLKTVTDKIIVKNPASQSVPRALIHCTANPNEGPLAPMWARVSTFAEKVQAQGWHYRALPTDHRPMHTMPHELTELLLEFA